MNINMLMQQAQKMQNEIMKKKEEINAKEFIGNSELIQVVMMGNKTIKSVNIKNNKMVLEDEKEILEDMIVIAFNDAIGQIDKEVSNKLGQYGSALNGLM